jgi:hypothetical protein
MIGKPPGEIGRPDRIRSGEMNLGDICRPDLISPGKVAVFGRRSS